MDKYLVAVLFEIWVEATGDEDALTEAWEYRATLRRDWPHGKMLIPDDVWIKEEPPKPIDIMGDA